MSSTEIKPEVAPDMGDAASGVKSFQQPKAPYVRGGGTPATRELEQASLLHLAGWHGAPDDPDAPGISVVATGQAANHTVFRGLYGAGHLVSSKHLFGTTKVDLHNTYEEIGLGSISWVNPEDTQEFINNTNHSTQAWFVEAVSNPAGRVPDFEALGKAAKERNIPLIVDMTLAAGMPAYDGLKHADILTCSLTKQAGGGNNENTGGVIIVNNSYAWHDNLGKFPELRSYFKDANGNLDLPAKPFSTLMTKISLHEGSGAVAPRVALDIAHHLPGMEYRVKRMCHNAKGLAEILMDHKKVNSVQLAGFNSDPENDARAQKYLGNNHFVIMFDLKGGFEAATRFIDADGFYHAVALGQRVTAVSHPASSTHRQYSQEALAEMGIYGGTIRMSVGIEGPTMLQRQLVNALAI